MIWVHNKHDVRCSHAQCTCILRVESQWKYSHIPYIVEILCLLQLLASTSPKNIGCAPLVHTHTSTATSVPEQREQLFQPTTTKKHRKPAKASARDQDFSVVCCAMKSSRKVPATKEAKPNTGFYPDRF